MTSPLDHKTIVITGAAQGLGLAISHDLVSTADDLTLILIDRASAELAATIKELTATTPGAQIIAIEQDVRHEDSLKQKVTDAITQAGRVDILINNAGTNVDATLETLDTTTWDDIIESNLRGPYLMSQIVWPHMKQQRDGHIVNIVSGIAMRVIPKSPAYPASKWGLRALNQSLYIEGRSHNIRVTAFMPAGMATPLILGRRPDADLEKLMDPKSVAQFLRVAILELDPTLAVPEVYLCRRGFAEWP